MSNNIHSIRSIIQNLDESISATNQQVAFEVVAKLVRLHRDFVFCDRIESDDDARAWYLGNEFLGQVGVKLPYLLHLDFADLTNLAHRAEVHVGPTFGPEWIPKPK